MNWNRSLDLLQVHCQGEIGKVIMSGAPEIPGATMLDKMDHINTVDDSLRRFVTFEQGVGERPDGRLGGVGDHLFEIRGLDLAAGPGPERQPLQLVSRSNNAAGQTQPP